MLRYGFILAVILLPIIASAEEVDPWLGKIVLLKPGVVPAHEGTPVFISFPARVIAADGDRVWLQRAWVKKTDLLTLDEALEFSNEQIETDPNNTKMWRLRGLALLGKGEWLKGIDSLNEAIRLDPTDWEVLVDRGCVRGQRAEYRSAFNDFAEAIRLHPTIPVAYYSRGVFKALNNEFDEAILDCRRAIELNPHCDEAFRSHGLALAMKGEFEAAVEAFNEAIRLSPRNDASFRNRGICWFKLKNFEQALSDAEEAIRLNSQSPSAYNLSGACWVAKDECGKAIQVLSHSIALKPHVGSLQLRAVAYRVLANDREALKDYETMSILAPSDAKALLDLAAILAASPDESVRDGKRAIDLATHICEMTEWQNDSMIAVLAAGYAEAGQWEDAIRFQKKAIEKAPAESLKRRREALQLYEMSRPFRFTPALVKERFKFNLSFTPFE